MGNPKKKSRFWCLHCQRENCVGQGIQRGGKQREKGHVKDLLCLNKECISLPFTKNLEIRYCDDFLEMMNIVPILHTKYYGV